MVWHVVYNVGANKSHWSQRLPLMALALPPERDRRRHLASTAPIIRKSASIIGGFAGGKGHPPPPKIVTITKSVCWSIDKSMGVYHHVVKRCFCRVPSLPSLTKYSPLFPIDIVIGHVAPSSYWHCDRAGSYWHCDRGRRADADVLHLVEVPAGGWVAALCDF